MKTTSFISSVALLFASQAVAAPAPAEMGILIATDNFSACNCPNNCDHFAGSSCKYYDGPSNTSPIYEGFCSTIQGPLLCLYGTSE